MQPIDLQILGISIIPIIYRSKKPAIPWQRYQLSPSTQQQLAEWFDGGRRMNAAAVCGWFGFTVLDFDDMAGYVEWLRWAIGQGGMAQEVALCSYRVRTPRGMHLYTFIDETPRCGKFKWGDIKGQGGYVLIPPSVHPSGVPYRVAWEGPILRVLTLAELVPEGSLDSGSRPGMTGGEGSPAVGEMSSLWPKSLVERIKAAVPLLEYFPKARSTGGERWFRTQCLFHEDRDPSFWIDAQRGICGCFSGCTPKPLDVINVHARLNNISDREAIRQLSERL